MTANYDQPDVMEMRVRFFDGQFLQDQDFVDEQKYHLDRERRPLRLLHVAGIADGLAVTASAQNQVSVAPGTAVDSDGRQLALAQATVVDLPAEKFNDKQGVELYISYDESAQDEQTEAGSADFTRWLERPVLTALAPGDSYAGTTPPVLLAGLSLDNSGRVTIDETVRSYSGLRLPGPADGAPALRTTASGQVSLEGALTVDGTVGLGTAAATARLSVEGDLSFTNTTASIISSAARLHISGEEILYLLNKSGVIVGKEWGGTGGLTVEGDVQAQGNLNFTNTTASIISSAARLHISGEERLYLLNKSGVIVGKEWGGTGNLSIEGDVQAGGAVSVQGVLSVIGNSGLGTLKPQAQLSVVAPKATEIAGSAQSAVLRTSAGTLDTAQGGELALSSTGLTVGSNSVSLGVRAIRTAKGSDWTTSALGLGMDVDNTVRAGASVFLHANGNVGIGTTAPPTTKLSVLGDLSFTNTTASTISSAARLHITGEEHLYLLNKTGVTVGQEWGGTGSLGVEGDLQVSGAASVTGTLGVSGYVGLGTAPAATTTTVRLSVQGDLGFTNTTASTISSAKRLHITGEELLYLLNKNGVVVGKEWGGTGNLTVEGQLIQSSDARLKGRIRRLESTLDRLASIRGVCYLPRQVGENANQAPAKPAIGVIAQEVEAVFPELVSTPEGFPYKGVEYGGLTAVLLEAVKELKATLDPLIERVAELEANA